MIKNSRGKVELKTRSEKLEKSDEHEEEYVTCLIMDYNVDKKILKNIIKKNWSILVLDETWKRKLSSTPKITYRKTASLGDLLTHSQLETKELGVTSWLNTPGFWKCSKCRACEHGRNTRSYRLQNGKVEQIIDHITCESKYVIYVLECPCRKLYVGSTINKLKLRILQHLRAIKNKDLPYPMAKHFWENHSGDNQLLTYFGVKIVKQKERGGGRTLDLRNMESRYILAIGTEHPFGHNLDAELHVHL